MAIIKIKVTVPLVGSVLALYDHIEVQRSVAGSPYSDAVSITASAPASAKLVNANAAPFASLQFKTLKLKVSGGSEQTITFEAGDPTTLTSAISQINAQVEDALASGNSATLFRLSTVVEGTQGLLEITGGTALDILGLTVGQTDNGEDAHIRLVPDASEYAYLDHNGLATNYYRTRYINQISGTYDTWSAWAQGTTDSAVLSTHLIVGKIKLADIDGTALADRDITIVNIYQPILQDAYFMAGRCLTVSTDATGQAQVTLIKGSTVDMIIEGTSIIRRILVPSSGTEFNLLDPTLQTDDPFGIQVPDLPAAGRSS